MNFVGTDFSFNEHYNARQIYCNNRPIFKIFIDLYSFLNPLDEELSKKEEKELESPSTLPKLAKLKTSAPKEEEIKEVKFKSEKIGKIFAAFARKADVDISLKNSFKMAYGASFSFFVEIFMQYGLHNRNKISPDYYYYIKKAPNQHSISTNIKFYYLKYFF